VKKFPTYYETRKFITASTTARHLSLSWARSIQSVPLFYFSKINFNTYYLLTYAWLCQVVSIFQVSPPKPCMHLFFPPWVFGLYWRISPSPRLLWLVPNMLKFLRWGVVSWRTTTCRLSWTAYSIYSHLLSISAGRSSIRQPEDAPCRSDRDPFITLTGTHLRMWQGPTYQWQGPTYECDRDPLITKMILRVGLCTRRDIRHLPRTSL
jgi:hypothetical protein